MDSANTFKSLKPDFKESYSDNNPKRPRFHRLRGMLKSRKATAELEASKDPMKALKDKSYLNLKGKKGVAV